MTPYWKKLGLEIDRNRRMKEEKVSKFFSYSWNVIFDLEFGHVSLHDIFNVKLEAKPGQQYLAF